MFDRVYCEDCASEMGVAVLSKISSWKYNPGSSAVILLLIVIGVLFISSGQTFTGIAAFLISVIIYAALPRIYINKKTGERYQL